MKRFKTGEYVGTLVLLIVIVVGFLGFHLGLKAALGAEYPLAAVASKSMVPTLCVGDLIVVQGGMNASEIRAAPFPDGDIIVFRKPKDSDNLIVHRAIGTTREGFKTKGDNNDHEDPVPVPENFIIGRVVGRIPMLGYLSLFLQTPGGIIVYIALILAIVSIEYVSPERKNVNLPTIKGPLLCMLALITFLPYAISFATSDATLSYNVEIVALVLWYVASLATPLAVRELDTGLLFWFYYLFLVGIPVGSDVVYRTTGIMPSMWWQVNQKNLMPVVWYWQGVLTRSYYSFVNRLGLLLAPGCLFLVVMLLLLYVGKRGVTHES